MSDNYSTKIQSTGFIGSGFWSKLGMGLCLALLAVYGVLWGEAVQSQGGPDSYVRLTDFLIQITGATILSGPSPELLYNLDQQRAVQENLLPADQVLTNLLPYNHPPFVALAIAPLVRAGWPVQAVFTAWTLVSAGAAGISLGVLAAGWSPRRSASWLVMLASTSFFPLIVALMQGQPTLLVLLGWAGCSAALKLKHDWLAGSMLALAILKPQALPLLLIALLIAGRWRALAGFATTSLIATVVIMPFAGVDWPLRYLRLLLDTLTLPSGATIVPELMQNMRGLFSGLFGVGVGTPLGLLFLALCAAGMIWLWRSGPRWNPDSPAWDLRWALTLFLAMLTSVHTYGHDLVLAVVPGWILATLVANGDIPAARRLPWLVWLWLGYAIGPIIGVPNLLPGYPGVLWLLVTCVGILWELRRRRSRSATVKQPEEQTQTVMA